MRTKKSVSYKTSRGNLPRDMVYDHIIKKILDGSIQFGARLPEPAIAAELGVSRTPVHDALTKLVNKGIAVHTPGGGVFLREITRSDLKDTMEMRCLYEKHAVGVAAENCPQFLLAKMRESCDMMRELGESIRAHSLSMDEQWHIKNRAEIIFHLSIIQTTGNNQLIRSFSDTMLLAKTLCPFGPDYRDIALSILAHTYWEHRKILHMIEKGKKTQVVAQMERHINAALRTTLADYDRRSPITMADEPILELYDNLL